MTVEIDQQIVEHIMGGFMHDPDHATSTDEIGYYLHPRGGVLRGMPYALTDGNEGFYDRMWEKWHPSEDIAAAFDVVMVMYAQGYLMLLELAYGGKWRCKFWTLSGISQAGVASTPSEAICLAALGDTGE